MVVVPATADALSVDVPLVEPANFKLPELNVWVAVNVEAADVTAMLAPAKVVAPVPPWDANNVPVICVLAIANALCALHKTLAPSVVKIVPAAL